MKTTGPFFRPFGKGNPNNVEQVSEGVVVHWATPRRDRVAEAKSEEERRFFADFGPRYSRRYPGPQARG